MSLNRDFLKLAIPNVLSNLAVPALSITDTALMGHMPDPVMLGAVAISAQVFTCLYWSFGFLRMGTTGLTAQAHGKKSGEELVFLRALLSAVILSSLILLFQVPLARLAFSILDLDSDLLHHAKTYFDIRIFAAPATLMLYVFHGWFLGMQNSWFPLLLAYLGNIINICVSIYLVRYKNMDVAGVAWGTLIAQYMTLLLSIILARKYFKSWPKIQWEEVFRWQELKVFLSLNRDLFIRTGFLLAVVSSFTFISERFGSLTLGANAILLSLATCLAYMVDGYAFAAESLCGKLFGQKNVEGLKKLLSLSFNWSIISGLTFLLIFYLFDEQILSVFTSQKDVIMEAKKYYPWLLLACVLNPIAFIIDGIFIGLAKAAIMRRVMIGCALFVYLPSLYIFWSFDNHGLWLSMSLFMLMRSLYMSYELKKMKLTSEVNR
ncbi:MATE family efflux transporter [Lentisphaera profundi]|uniref:MATE family efflux transporter n=1 Tax=Lentisphaera profundi TaxID=1658616 RepID=A0ABY7VT47_9BACT|nr:MATE family efflux transporter [Lentisphaera profundi]WDE97081.1 MATE family efflux transporter [Lentisphaera profundi]